MFERGGGEGYWHSGQPEKWHVMPKRLPTPGLDLVLDICGAFLFILKVFLSQADVLSH